MQKKEARKIFRKKRDAISYAEKNKMDDLILIQFQKLNLPFVSNVFSFYPIEEKNEINSFIITDYLNFINPGLHIGYPRINTENETMEAITGSYDFEPNEAGIPEPLNGEVIEPYNLDIVLIPLLAFDENGIRVGYGKGYYDKYLKQCNDDCIKIGLSYFEPVNLIEDANEYDVPLNFCITPQQVYVF